MNFFKSLYGQVMLALFLGVLFGYMVPEVAVQFRPLSDAFIKLIKMLISPIIFLTLVSGIAAMNDVKYIGKIAGGALVFFTLITSAALVFGLCAAHYFKPGVGLNIAPNTLNIAEVGSYLGDTAKIINIKDLFINIIPKTFFSAFVDGEMLQVIFVSLLFALGLIVLGPTGQPIVQGMQILSKVFFKIIHMVMYLAPIATFSAMAFSVGKFGIAPLFNLAGLIFCYYVVSIAFIVIVLGSILQFYCQINLKHLLVYLKDELFIVFGTGSSETVLPSLMEKLEQLGCEETAVGLILPLGYSFNLAGTAIYLTLASLLIAQATNTELTLWQELSLLGVMVISSKGAAGVSGSGFIVLASSLATLGHIPAAGVVLVLGIDKFMNEGRAITNMLGNAIATVIICVWQNRLIGLKLEEVLGGEIRALDIA